MTDGSIQSLDTLEGVRRAARTLAENAATHDRDGADPLALCEPLAREGLFVAALPIHEGGRGWATGSALASDLARVLMALGAADLSAGRLFEGHVNAIKLVAHYGSKAQLEDLASDVRDGAVAGVWNAEGPPGLRLEQAPSPGSPARLTGGKIYCSGLGLVSRPLVTARTPDGELLMLAPRRWSGGGRDLSDWTVQGMRASATGSVDFTGEAITAEEIVGGPGDYLAPPLFKGGAWRFAAVQAGAVARLAVLVRRELRARRRDGDPHQKARIGALEIAAQTAELWAVRAAEIAEGGLHAAEAVDSYAGLARTAVEQAAMNAIATAERALGLPALMRPSLVERIIRDLSTYLRQPFPDAARDEAAAFAASCPGPAPWTLTPEVRS